MTDKALKHVQKTVWFSQLSQLVGAAIVNLNLSEDDLGKILWRVRKSFFPNELKDDSSSDGDDLPAK